jgi:hypothetical protein
MNPVRTLTLAVLVSAVPLSARASCGASSCAMDMSSHEKPAAGAVRLDLSFQYLDQNRPRAGTRRAIVGEIPNDEHNEVATINRVWMARVDYDATDRFGLSASLPLISRAHDHIAVDTGEAEHWDFTGLGDVPLMGRWAALPRSSPEDAGVVVSGGLKLPSGDVTARNGAERAEVTIQPGSGSFDLLFGATAEKGFFSAPGLDGLYSYVPVFVGFLYKENNPGSRGYRFGDELQVNAGAAYTLLKPLDLLAQANLRVKRRDYNGTTGEDTSFTGGEFVYLSPGLRWRATEHAALYGYVQLPVRQRVNQEQLTADRNWLFGVTYSF